MKTEFLKRLLQRTDKLDKQQVLDVLGELIEERNLLRLLFDSMVEGMVVIGPERSVNFCNETASRILGIPSGETERDLEKVFSSQELLELCRKGVDKPDTIRDHRVNVNIDGTSRILRVNILPLRNPDGKNVGALVLFMDITDQIEQQERLRHAEKLAAMTTLAAGLTHEIRNPLNSLSIHLQIIQRQIDKKLTERDEGVQKTLDLLGREVKRLNDVVELFLKAARPSQPEFRRVSLFEIITETLALLHPELERCKIDVQLIEGSRRPDIWADDRLLRQVFINLVQNASEAIDEAVAELGEDVERRITIRLDADENATMIRIQDTGAGMLQEDVKHIFEPYFTTKDAGTGLGLMVSEGIIRQHGGQMDVRSQVGVGTEFTITLPPPLKPTQLIHDDSGGTVQS